MPVRSVIRPIRLVIAVVLAALALAACTSTAPSAEHPTVTPPATPTTAIAPTTATPPASTRATTRAPSLPKPKPRHTTAPPPAHTPTPTQRPAPPAVLPLRASTGTARQVVTVVAPSTGSTTATVQAWQRNAAGWQRVGAAVPAHVGSDGLSTHPSESRSATPIGSFTLTQAFGSAADPGTQLPYFTTDASDWWVSDPSSQYYNTHYRCRAASCPFDTGDGENLLDAGYVYTYAVVIDYNRAPVVKGAGSAFFLHVTNGQPTAGCVSIPEGSLVSIMRWLDPAAHPRILIGTG